MTWPAFKTDMPLFWIQLLGSGIIRWGSISSENPKPEHLLHAPKGVLKEKLLGSSSDKEILQSMQAKCSE